MNWLLRIIILLALAAPLWLSPGAKGDPLSNATAVPVGVDTSGSAIGDAESKIEVGSPLSKVHEIGLELLIQIGQSRYLVGVAPPSQSPSHAGTHQQEPLEAQPQAHLEPRQDHQYQLLPADEKAAFLRNRKHFLEATAKGLQLAKYGIGIGAVAKDRMTYLVRKVRRQDYEPQARITHQSLKLYSEDVILNILRALDKKLFESAPIIARANEFGIVLAGGIEALGGNQQRGWGGLLDLGISLGFNTDSRGLVIQVFRDVEKYQSSMMPAIALGGVVSKAGLYAVNQREQLSETGSSFYPPMIPGFRMKTENFVMFGFSTGLTWPPSPIGDLLTYSNHLDHARIFRLTLSPFLRGFVRVQSSLLQTGPADVRMLLTSVTNAISKVRSLSSSALSNSLGYAPRPQSCRSFFTKTNFEAKSALH